MARWQKKTRQLVQIIISSLRLNIGWVDDDDNCLQTRKKNLQDDGIVWKTGWRRAKQKQNKNDKLLNMNVTNDDNGDGDNDDDNDDDHHHHRNKSFSERK